MHLSYILTDVKYLAEVMDMVRAVSGVLTGTHGPAVIKSKRQFLPSDVVKSWKK